MVESSFIPRHARQEVVDALTEARIVALLGPRQAGKSTLARSLLSDGQVASLHSLDNDDVREAARLDPRGFVAGLKLPAVIDEIQRAPELLLALKAHVDIDLTPGQFLLTGSANLTTLPAVSDALPGRVDFVDLWPFTRGEIEGVRESFIDDAFANRMPAIQDAPIGRMDYASLLEEGGFPAARVRAPKGRSRYFDGYARSIFGGEIRNVSSGDPRTTEHLLRLVAARSGSLTNFAEMGRSAGVTEKTARAHIDTLEKLLLVRQHRPWLSNLGKRLVKSPRLYVCDTGLMCHLAGISADRLAKDGTLAGPVFETFVVMELLRQATWNRARINVLHYRDKDQREIDVVLERADGSVVAIEVKSRATVRAADFRAMNYLRTRLGEAFACGIVLYLGPETLPFGEGMWAVPLSGLWTPAAS